MDRQPTSFGSDQPRDFGPRAARAQAIDAIARGAWLHDGHNADFASRALARGDRPCFAVTRRMPFAQAAQTIGSECTALPPSSRDAPCNARCALARLPV